MTGKFYSLHSRSTLHFFSSVAQYFWVYDFRNSLEFEIGGA